MNYCTDIGLPPQVVLRFIRATFPPTRHCLGSSLRSFSEHLYFPIQSNPPCFSYSNLTYRVSQKKAFSECLSHSALAQSQVAGTPCVWKLIVWSFLTKTKPDQAFPSHAHGNN